MSGLIPLLKLFIDSGAVSPKAPTEVRRFFEREKTVGDDPTSKAGVRPNCGLGAKAVLINDEWVCVPSFK
jgi:hypothetical protein